MIPFEVTILGCSSATPTADRHPSAQVVNIGGECLLIDCGEGTQMQLTKYGIRWGKIGFILISHLHGDHFLGLPGLLSTMSLMGRKEELVLLGPAPLKAFIDRFLSISESRLSFDLTFVPTNPAEPGSLYQHPLFCITGFPLNHRIACTGFVLSERHGLRKIVPEKCEAFGVPVSFYKELKLGLNYTRQNGETVQNTEVTLPPAPTRKYAYCSDTVYDEAIVPRIAGVNLLYHEATFLHELLPRAETTFHTTARQAGMMAAKAGVKKLSIGHFSSRYKNLDDLLQEAQAEHPNTVLATEGLTIAVE